MQDEFPQVDGPQTAPEAAEALASAVLTDVALELGNVVPADSTKAWGLLWAAAGLRFRVGMALADAVERLASRRMQTLLPKDREITELDRTTTQAAASAPQEGMVKRLEMAMELLNSRVDLLSAYVAFLQWQPDTTGKEELANGSEAD